MITGAQIRQARKLLGQEVLIRNALQYGGVESTNGGPPGVRSRKRVK